MTQIYKRSTIDRILKVHDPELYKYISPYPDERLNMSELTAYCRHIVAFTRRGRIAK